MTRKKRLESEGQMERLPIESLESAIGVQEMAVEAVFDKAILEFLKELKEYRTLEEQGLLQKLPCTVGDTIYVICECEYIPPQLDGTLYDSSGGYGTATGYYCPYENNCPHECEDCEECKNVSAVFEDEVVGICIDEIGVSIYSKNCYVNGSLGEYIFLSEAEAQEALKRLESEEQ